MKNEIFVLIVLDVILKVMRAVARSKCTVNSARGASYRRTQNRASKVVLLLLLLFLKRNFGLKIKSIKRNIITSIFELVKV